MRIVTVLIECNKVKPQGLKEEQEGLPRTKHVQRLASMTDRLWCSQCLCRPTRVSCRTTQTCAADRGNDRQAVMCTVTV